MSRYLFLLILFTILVYFNSFDNAFVWDDLNNIVHNESLKGPVVWSDVFLKLQPPAQFYRPIPFLTITLDHLLWGNNPFGYHLTNLVFHLFNVLIIFYITVRLTNSNLISFICSLLFAIHPVQTEAITYISGRSDPICAFFLLASFYFYIKYADTIAHNRLIYLISSLSLFLLGLFSKEIAVIFPLALLIFDVLFLDSPFRVRFKRNVLFLSLAIVFLLFRYIFIRWQPVEVGLGHIYLLPQILLYYLKLLLFPFNLHMQHSIQEMNFISSIVLAIFAILSLLFTISRIIKNRAMLFGLVWFLICLSPFLGVLRLNSDIAEHWLYLASFGFFLMISILFVRNKLLKNRFALSVAVLALCILTIQRNVVWRDDLSIYKDTLKYKYSDPKLHYNMGNAYSRRGMFDDALNEYSIALKQKPDYSYALNNLRLISTLALAEEVYFDHSLYKNILTKFVKNGNVDYLSLKNDSLDLDAYLKNVAELKPGELNNMSTNDKIAFYLNIYNAITLKVITRYYPVRSIKDIPGVWDKLKFKVAGKEVTLNNIEHDILRKEFHEPRIHFALVCASRSCPGLAEEPFNGKDLNTQLDREAREFINDRTKVRLDKYNKILYLSSIFKWFKEDFGNPIEFVSKYISKDDVRIIQEGVRVKYLNYDWSLNEKL